MTISIEETFVVPKTIEETYHSLVTWGTLYNAGLADYNQPIYAPRLILYPKYGGNIKFPSKPVGELNVKLRKIPEGTLVSMHLISSEKPDIMKKEDVIKSSLYYRVESYLKYVKVPIPEDRIQYFYSDNYIRENLNELNVLTFFFLLLYSWFPIFLYLNDPSYVWKLRDYGFIAIFPLLLILNYVREYRNWQKRANLTVK